MAERLVVCYRAKLSSLGGRYVDRTRAIIGRAAVLSGELLSFGATELLFAFPPDALEKVITLVREPETVEDDELRFACAVAQGDVQPIDGTLMAWGTALAVASGLAAVTEPGEVTLSEALKAFRQGELLTLGTVISRTTGVRIRGARLDLAQPFRREAASRVARVHSPSRFIGAEDPGQLVWPGSLSVLRADPGLGGTRFLAEIKRAQAPARALFVSPSGSGSEPLGALRRAVARSNDVNPFLLELAPSVERLAAGDGVTLEEAARIVAAFLWPKSSAEQPGPLLVDDASEVDEASLVACARALAQAERSFPFIIRLDATGRTPRSCAELAPGPEAELGPLPRMEAETLGAECVDGRLDAVARKRWARLGGNAPLGIQEAICHGIAAGDLVWRGENASPRRRSAGKGKVRPARQWIALRAMEISTSGRTMLALLSLLGGEAHVPRMERILARADLGVPSPRMTLEELGRNRFLYEVRDGWVALASRTHRDALSEIVDDNQKKTLHRLIADVLEMEEGRLAKAEAAFHAARAGEGPRAAKLALGAARAASELGLEFAAARLLAFAREQDPSVKEETRAHVASSIPPRASGGPGALKAPGDVASPVARLIVSPSAPAAAPAPGAPPPLPPPRVPAAAGSPSRASTNGAESEHVFGVISAAMPESAVPFTEEDPSAVLDVVVPVPAEERTSAPPEAREMPTDFAPPPSSAPRAMPSGLRPDTPGADLLGSEDRPSKLPTDSEPPTLALTNLAPFALGPGAQGSAPPQSTDGNPQPAASHEEALIAERLTELAKEALLGADTASLERWVDNLGATGEHAMLADRMRAMARLSRGEIGDALRVLKRARASLPKEATGLRCQTSLALGMALAVAGRSEEALLEGLDALSRARQSGDARGTSACLAFLAKLYASVDRAEDASRLRFSTPPPPVAGS